jgi:hypothetical protein
MGHGQYISGKTRNLSKPNMDPILPVWLCTHIQSLTVSVMYYTCYQVGILIKVVMKRQAFDQCNHRSAISISIHSNCSRGDYATAIATICDYVEEKMINTLPHRPCVSGTRDSSLRCYINTRKLLDRWMHVWNVVCANRKTVFNTLPINTLMTLQI